MSNWLKNKIQSLLCVINDINPMGLFGSHWKKLQGENIHNITL